MSDLSEHLRNLVIANRILAHENVVDAYGHVSMRHPERPDRFFMSCSRSPELVTLDDIMEFDLDCNPIDQRGRMMYGERPIHGGVFHARPDVNAVVHNHAYEVIPFTVSSAIKLRPLLHVAGTIGTDIPIWDIRDNFGDTDMLVTSMAIGHDLARTLGSNRISLMRGHGCVVACESLKEAVMASVFLMVNARLQTTALQFGDIKYLSDGEIAKTTETMGGTISMTRAWEYWARRSGALGL